MLTKEQIVEKTQTWAVEKGVDAEALITEKQSFKISHDHGEVDEYNSSKDMAVGFRILRDGREGTSYSESFNEDDVKEAFLEAYKNSEFVEKEYTPELFGGSKGERNTEFYSEELAKSPIADKIAAAKSLEQIALNYDDRIKSLPYNGYSDFESEVLLFNTKGTHSSYRKNGCFVFAYTLASDGTNNGMAFDADVKKSLKDLDINFVAKNSSQRALKKLNAVRPKTGHYPILLSEKKCVATLFSYLLRHCNLEIVEKKESLFSGQLEQKILSEKLSVKDNPLFPGAMNSRPFDAEGVKSEVTPLFEKGVLKNFLSNSVLAKKYGYKNTGNAARSPHSPLSVSASNFVIDPGTKSFDELISSFPEVVLVDELKGLSGLNPVSGDFSIQSEGALYKNGEFVSTLKDFVISGNLVECFNNIAEVGSEVDNDPFNSAIVPALLIGDLSVAGES